MPWSSRHLLPFSSDKDTSFLKVRWALWKISRLELWYWYFTQVGGLFDEGISSMTGYEIYTGRGRRAGSTGTRTGNWAGAPGAPGKGGRAGQKWRSRAKSSVEDSARAPLPSGPLRREEMKGGAPGAVLLGVGVKGQEETSIPFSGELGKPPTPLTLPRSHPPRLRGLDFFLSWGLKARQKGLSENQLASKACLGKVCKYSRAAWRLFKGRVMSDPLSPASSLSTLLTFFWSPFNSIFSLPPPPRTVSTAPTKDRLCATCWQPAAAAVRGRQIRASMPTLVEGNKLMPGSVLRNLHICSTKPHWYLLI